jgi:arylsulfatase A-like enzyme
MGVNRRNRAMARTRISAVALSLLALEIVMRPGDAAADPPVRPHVVVIMTDDQRLDTLRFMPKTQSLIAAEGVVFANAFATFPVCSPARATFLTGKYAHNHQVFGNAPPLGGYSKLDHGNTLPVWLRNAGYRTAFAGKYLNHYGEGNPLEIPPGWDDWHALLDNRYYGFQLNENGALLTYGGDESQYQTDVLAMKADSIIRLHAASNSGQSLFLYVAPQAPHSGRNANAVRDDPDFAHLNHPFGPRAMRHLGLFDDQPLQESKAFNEKFIEDKPAHVRALDRMTTETTYGVEAHFRAKLEMLQAVDDLVETVVNALGDTGMLANTLLLYTSDNGFFHGEHRVVTGKLFPYDEALRVPLLVRGPGFPAGSTATQLVANVDIAPTVVALSGVTAGLVMDGRSLARLANDPESGRDRTILLEAFGSGPDSEQSSAAPGVNYRGIRDDRYQYVEYETGDRELYYLASDSAQVANRINDPRLAGVVTRMQAKLRQQENCRGGGCSRGTP